MIVEERIYRIRNGQVSAFLELVEKRALPIQQPILGNLLGYFRAEIGTLSEVVHLWGFESLDDRMERRAKLARSAEWQAVLPELSPFIKGAKNRILIPTSFSPIR